MKKIIQQLSIVSEVQCTLDKNCQSVWGSTPVLSRLSPQQTVCISGSWRFRHTFYARGEYYWWRNQDPFAYYETGKGYTLYYTIVTQGESWQRCHTRLMSRVPALRTMLTCWLVVLREVVNSQGIDPCAGRTDLGWVVNGPFEMETTVVLRQDFLRLCK